jgi:hypothetical protein
VFVWSQEGTKLEVEQGTATLLRTRYESIRTLVHGVTLCVVTAVTTYSSFDVC